MSTPMNIGTLARRSGVPTKTIRYYESVGLIESPARSDNGYRVYDEEAVRTLSFVRKSRELGFPLDEVRSLLSLWHDKQRSSGEVRALAQARIQDIDARILELQRLRGELGHLVQACHGDNRPECPILDALEPHTERTDT